MSRQTPQDTAPETSPPPRIVVENLRPEIEGGRFPIKRTVGEEVVVTADIHADGHDEIAAVLRYRRGSEASWTERPMEPLGNDAWRAAFTVATLEPHCYTVEAWIDRFATWRRDLRKRIEAGNAEAVDLLVGADLVAEAAGHSRGASSKTLAAWAAELRDRAAQPSPVGFRSCTAWRSWISPSATPTSPGATPRRS